MNVRRQVNVLLVLFAIVCSCLNTGIRPRLAGPTERIDLQYVQSGDSAQRLDLYLPNRTGPHPLVIFIHGGSWRAGDKTMPAGGRSNYAVLRKTLNDQGYAVASVQYRFAPKHPFPAAIHDVKAATRFLRAKSAELGLDPDRFAAVGDSAGGHLALLLAMSAETPDLEGDLGYLGVASTVQAAVGYYGVYDFTQIVEDRFRAGCGRRQTGRETTAGRLLGYDPGAPENRERALHASPIGHLRGAVPTLLIHGTKDCVVPHAQAQRFHDALRFSGADSELVLIEGGHADSAFFQNRTMQHRLLGFLDQHL